MLYVCTYHVNRNHIKCGVTFLPSLYWQEETLAIPSKEWKVGTKKDKNQEKYTSQTCKNEFSHQEKGDASSSGNKLD